MTQHAHLFIEGGIRQQWFHVPHEGRVIVYGHDTYYRRVIESLSWVVPIEVFVHRSIEQIPPGTPMPGWVCGEVPERSHLPGNWMDGLYHARKLREAVARENRRRLT